MVSERKDKRRTVDGSEAVADVAYRMSEIISIYPITPSSGMAEICDEWSAAARVNLWDEVPEVVQMQSEGGVAGALHGTLMGGSLSTTFTASQGLLLMIPNMYKIAGELTPTVIHVSARALATNALSIFGDHSDVMACRQTGFAMLASNSVQEAHDLAAIAHAATLRSRIPFLHFFDGFRTSHEINSLDPIPDHRLKALLDTEALNAFHARGLTPDAPTVRGTAHNPDTYFQSREAVNPAYRNGAGLVQEVMDEFAMLTGRQYRLFDYIGHPEAEEVIVMMGSGVETAAETAQWLNANTDRKVGVLAVRLYRPFNTHAFNHALPKTVRAVAVLDRTKEPGGIGEPLYLDVALALRKASTCLNLCRPVDPVVVGGRYGIGSKEFTPAMAQGVFDELRKTRPRDHFTVGIRDDVTDTSLDYDKSFTLPAQSVTAALFYGVGSDGTVGANKNTIKIIGEARGLHAQAYFVYDSKKSGGQTVSHLRFGPDPIRAPYLIEKAQFVACHQPQLLGRADMLDRIADGGTFLLNTPLDADRIWDHLPASAQQSILTKKLRFFVLDAYAAAGECGMGRRINTIMQVGFFALSNLIPVDEACDRIKKAITKTYARKGPEVVKSNCAAVDQALAYLKEVSLADKRVSGAEDVNVIPAAGGDFVNRVTTQLLAGKGDLLPVSAFPVDGVWPTGTSRFEKRNVATEIPVWDPDACTQCNKCTLFCPHAAIRGKTYDATLLQGAPDGFRSCDYKGPGGSGKMLTLQVYPEDCTGCGACVELCPARNAEGRRAIEMEPVHECLDRERENLVFFETLPYPKIDTSRASARTLPFKQPLFEFSGACSGCTQTPYVRILSQLFGDRLLMANATGCSSIYGGNLPTTPYCTDDDGRGPAWANSLFEDNAEFGLGLHMSAERRRRTATRLLETLSKEISALTSLKESVSASEITVEVLREQIAAAREALGSATGEAAHRLLQHIDYLVPKSTWILGGDGWAYDIGYGGLDHVLASGRNVNILVLDTEVYSNTGGQASKATPLGAQAKFASSGKSMPKKDLGQIAMSYGGVYVAQIALGANEQQAIDVLRDAESYDGPSLVIAYGPCLAHGIDLRQGPARQKAAVESGYWPLYRFDPRMTGSESPAFRLDSFAPEQTVASFMRVENRFRALERTDPQRAQTLAALAQEQVDARWKRLEQMANASLGEDEDDDDDGWG